MISAIIVNQTLAFIKKMDQNPSQELRHLTRLVFLNYAYNSLILAPLQVSEVSRTVGCFITLKDVTEGYEISFYFDDGSKRTIYLSDHMAYPEDEDVLEEIEDLILLLK